MSKKILLVEDKMSSLNTPFKLANLRKFQGSLVIRSVPRSQDVNYDTLKDDYDLVFVDITLAERSQKNGYGVLKDILAHDYFPKNKLIVLTGNMEIEESLKQNGLPLDLEILRKPVSFPQLEKILINHLSPTLNEA
ncbi:MAG: hypothetical protein HDR84_08310 [Bacteroides sp.]|nr:hypothetical protein [Bacteroides sp.]